MNFILFSLIPLIIHQKIIRTVDGLWFFVFHFFSGDELSICFIDVFALAFIFVLALAFTLSFALSRFVPFPV